MQRSSGRRSRPQPDEPAPAEPFEVGAGEPYVPTDGFDVGLVALDASPVYGVEDVVAAIVCGSDPWLGAPLTTLETASGEVVTSPNGTPVGSDGCAVWVDIVYDPLYEDDEDVHSRTSLWTFSMPTQLTVAGLVPDLTEGSNRLRIRSPPKGEEPMEVTSAEFTVR